MKLTKGQARQFILAHQHLWPPRQLEGKQGILDFIEKVSCIQFDPLDRVGYNPNLVLQSRIKNYKKQDLYDLLYQDRKLIDGWDKNMAIYMAEDWPYFSRYRQDAYQKYTQKSKQLNKILPHVRQEIEAQGPVSSSDLDFDEKIDWSWAPTRAARAALESMYFWGELVVHHKEGTRKYYDLASKCLPADLLDRPDPNTTMEEYYAWYVMRRIGALGMMWNLSGHAWLGIRWMKSKQRTAALKLLEEQGQAHSYKVEGLRHPLYMRTEDIDVLHKTLKAKPPKPQASFIAPLDNLIWERRLLKELFDFEYVWEVYKPAEQRQYGYYVLPVLYGDKFVARFEPKFDKESGTLEILNWWWEPEVTINKEMQHAITHCLEQFGMYLQANSIKLTDSVVNSNKLTWLSL